MVAPEDFVDAIYNGYEGGTTIGDMVNKRILAVSKLSGDFAFRHWYTGHGAYVKWERPNMFNSILANKGVNITLNVRGNVVTYVGVAKDVRIVVDKKHNEYNESGIVTRDTNHILALQFVLTGRLKSPDNAKQVEPVAVKKEFRFVVRDYNGHVGFQAFDPDERKWRRTGRVTPDVIRFPEELLTLSHYFNECPECGSREHHTMTPNTVLCKNCGNMFERVA